MKPRRWILYILITVVALGFGSMTANRMLERSKAVERLLSERVSPLIGGTFVVDRVRMGFFSIYLSGVQVDMPISGATFSVRDIKIGFSLYKLIKSRFDLSRSIAKFILVKPAIKISLFADLATHKPLPHRIPLAIDFPIDQLFISQGTIAIIDGKGNQTVFGEELAGGLKQTPAGIELSLTGSCASHKKNLAVTGFYSYLGERNNLSVRIENAHIEKPLDLKTATITSGNLNGTIEVFFGDTVGLDNIDMRGWLSFSKGLAVIGTLPDQVQDIAGGLHVAGTEIVLDSLTSLYRGVNLAGSGSWDFATPYSSGFTFSCNNIVLDSLVPHLATDVKQNILGTGWLTAKLFLDSLYPGVSCMVRGGGVSVGGVPLTTISARCQITDSTLACDSLRIAGTGASLDVVAIYNLKSNGLQGNFTGRIDSLPGVTWYTGKAHVKGTFDVLQDTLSLALDVQFETLRCKGVILGSPHFSIMYRNGYMSIASAALDRELIDVQMSIDGIDEKHPRISGTVKPGKKIVASMVDSLPMVLKEILGAPDVNFFIESTMPACSVNCELKFSGTRGSGTLLIAAQTNDIASARFTLQGTSTNLMFGTWPLRFTTALKVSHDSLDIVAFQVNRWAGLSGRILLRPQGDIDVQYHVDSLPLALIADGSSFPLKSGLVSSAGRISGFLNAPVVNGTVRVRNASIAMVTSCDADAVVFVKNAELTLLPCMIWRQGRPFIALDTLVLGRTMRIAGEFGPLSLESILDTALLGDHRITGVANGTFSTGTTGWPLTIRAQLPTVSIDDTWRLDSCFSLLSLYPSHLKIDKAEARDGNRSRISLTGLIPFAAFDTAQHDTGRVLATIQGDLLKTIESNLVSPVGGTGIGTVSVGLMVSSGEVQLASAQAHIPQGVLEVRPYIPDKVKNFTFNMSMADSSRINIRLSGTVNRRPISIVSTHQLARGYEPITLGSLDLGALEIITPDKGIDMHLPHFQEKGAMADLEFTGRGPFKNFTLSGPLDRLKLTGVMTIRSLDFTYPFLNEETLPMKFDPFPYITWEMDVKVGNRTVSYFYDLRDKHTKYAHLFDAYLDPSSVLMLRGRDGDKSFRLNGSIHSSKGAIYLGRIYDRNVDIGLEFSSVKLSGDNGYDFFPVMYGKAEALGDTSRLDRTLFTLKMVDPVTGSYSDKGRMAMIPATKSQLSRWLKKAGFDYLPNFAFVITNNGTDVTQLEQTDYARATAPSQGGSISSAGRSVSAFGEQYVHRYFLRGLEHRLAKTLGLDVVSLETSIASNYFNELQNDNASELRTRYNLLANSGVTVGRYFYSDYLFVKARGGFSSQSATDTLLRPTYSFGLELTPSQYLMMDFNYGVSQFGDKWKLDPRVNVQLTMPMGQIRKLLDF